eukprot:6208040-Pleurochrysis_carterae.AAC.4
MGHLRVGTAGFSSVSSHWAGKAFPPGARGKAASSLDFYQEVFDVCEVNGTAHRMPSEASISAWRAHAAKGFLLALKVVATVTHCSNPESEESLAEFSTFLLRASGLGDALGPLLLQFPQSISLNLELLQALAAAVQRSSIPTVRIAVEVRHASWFAENSGFQDFLTQHGWALVAHPNSVGHSTITAERRSGELHCYDLEPLNESHPVTAGSWMYVRLHGRNDEHTYCYTDDELRNIARVLHVWRQRGLDVFCFFLNDDREAAMPRNARTLRELAYELAEEREPRMPKQPKLLTDFFGGAPAAKKRKV